MPKGYIQLGASCSSPSICPARATGCVDCCPLLTICPRCCPRHAPDVVPDMPQMMPQTCHSRGGRYGIFKKNEYFH